jgi:undecaprenyl-diphosphatase
MKTYLYRISALHLVLALGFAITVFLTLAAADGGTMPGDTRITREIQSVDATGAGTLVSFFNSTFDSPVLIAITTVLALMLGIVGRYAQMVLLAATIFGQATNAVLKVIIGRPRPEDGAVQVTEQATGLSFPSGHTMGTVVFCGIIVYLSFQLIRHRQLRILVQILAVAQMFAVGFSRVYTGAHWPSDVLGGFLWGTWFVLLLIVLYRKYAPRFMSHQPVTA